MADKRVAELNEAMSWANDDVLEIVVVADPTEHASGTTFKIKKSNMGFSLANHNHSGVYATAGHLHTGVYADIAHVHAAAAITFDPSGVPGTGTNVQAILAQVLYSVSEGGGSDRVANLVSMTEAEYAALGTKQATTLYALTP